jgi:hypothetical protein
MPKYLHPFIVTGQFAQNDLVAPIVDGVVELPAAIGGPLDWLPAPIIDDTIDESPADTIEDVIVDDVVPDVKRRVHRKR